MADVDINSDLGEGFGRWTMGDDEAVLDVVSSANIACGFHAGDPSIMRHLCTAAADRGVAIGAHVSYPDLAGFGRRFLDIDPAELRDAVTYQIGALQAFAAAAGTAVAYVKPHGALYNAIVHHRSQAQAVVDGIVAVGVLPVLGLAGSAVLELGCEAGLRSVHEAFVDRGYAADGTLMPRSAGGAVIHDVDVIVARTMRMVLDATVEAVDGSVVALRVDSLCVHGDTPEAVQIATAVRRALQAGGITVAPFA